MTTCGGMPRIVMSPFATSQQPPSSMHFPRMHTLLKRLHWLLAGRFLVRLVAKGFSCAPLAYADDVEFGAFSALLGRSVVSHSKIGPFTYLHSAQVGNAVIGGFCSI